MNLSQAIEGYLLFKPTRASPRTIETDRGNLRIFLKYLRDRPDLVHARKLLSQGRELLLTLHNLRKRVQEHPFDYIALILGSVLSLSYFLGFLHASHYTSPQNMPTQKRNEPRTSLHREPLPTQKGG